MSPVSPLLNALQRILFERYYNSRRICICPSSKRTFQDNPTPVGRMINNSSLFFFLCYGEERKFFLSIRELARKTKQRKEIESPAAKSSPVASSRKSGYLTQDFSSNFLLLLHSAKTAKKPFSHLQAQRNTTNILQNPQAFESPLRKSSFRIRSYKQSPNINNTIALNSKKPTLTFAVKTSCWTAKILHKLKQAAFVVRTAKKIKLFCLHKSQRAYNCERSFNSSPTYDSTSFERVRIFMPIRRHKRAQHLPAEHWILLWNM